MIIIDTNVVSELMKHTPDPAVASWTAAQTSLELCTTATTVAEIYYGVELLEPGRRRRSLTEAADAVFDSFRDRILDFDALCGRHYGAVLAQRGRAGTPMSVLDAQIAATCRRHCATLATRNTPDFIGLDLVLIDPWRAGG